MLCLSSCTRIPLGGKKNQTALEISVDQKSKPQNQNMEVHILGPTPEVQLLHPQVKDGDTDRLCDSPKLQNETVAEQNEEQNPDFMTSSSVH